MNAQWISDGKWEKMMQYDVNMMKNTNERKKKKNDKKRVWNC